MKTCTKCGEMKGLEAFHGDRTSRDGHCSRCKACAIAASKAYYQENKPPPKARRPAAPQHQLPSRQPGVQRQYKRAWADRNRQRVREKNRKFRATADGKRYARDYAAELRADLAPSYVRGVIAKREGLPAEAVPDELVEAKREHLRLVRFIKENSK